jgi:hypothetical protein
MHSIRVGLIALSSLIGFDGIAAYRSTSAKTTFYHCATPSPIWVVFNPYGMA